MSARLTRADALVIGGGPAGCAAAIALARSGRQVTLLERHAGPHDKVCGEFLSWEAAAMLQHLDIDLPALGAQPIDHLALSAADSALHCRLPFRAWSLSRRVLDAALQRRAEQAGVELLRGVPATGLRAEGEGWRVEGRTGEWQARELFLACGKRDLRGWRRRHADTRDLIGLKLHLRLAPAQAQALQGRVLLALFAGGYGGLEMVEDGRANLCFLIDKARYRVLAGGDPPAWLGELAPALGECLAGARSLWPAPLAVYRTPYGWLQQGATPAGLYRLGDQFGVIPSFAGDGIALALHSGLLAARASLDGAGAAAYAEQARRDFRRPIRNARFAEALLHRRGTRRALFLAARLLPALPAWGAAQVRLGEVPWLRAGAPDRARESGLRLLP